MEDVRQRPGEATARALDPMPKDSRDHSAIDQYIVQALITDPPRFAITDEQRPPDWSDPVAERQVSQLRSRQARIRAALRELRAQVVAAVPGDSPPGVLTPREILLNPLRRFEQSLGFLERVAGPKRPTRAGKRGAPRKDQRLTRAVRMVVDQGESLRAAADYVAGVVVRTIRKGRSVGGSRTRGGPIPIPDSRIRVALAIKPGKPIPSTETAWERHQSKLADRLRASYTRDKNPR